MQFFTFIHIQWLIYLIICSINSFSSANPSNVGILFDVTYLLMNDDAPSLNNLKSVNPTGLARILENTLQLSERNILQIKSINTDEINHNQFVRCIQNTTDPMRRLITFQILLTYPIRLNCQTSTCIDIFIRLIQSRFESLSTLLIQIKHILYTFHFCSINRHPTSTVANMTSPRMYHTSTFISTDNSVLITGGFNPLITSALATTNKFKILNDSVSLTPSKNMSAARYDHTADRIPSSGLVLLAGGMNSAYMPHNNAELFNPISGTTNIISMSYERATHKSAVISNLNKIILIGGQNSSYLAINTGDVFDGTNFLPVANRMIHERIGHTVTFLPTINKILITGGTNGNGDSPIYYNSVEMYDVPTNKFQTLSTIHMSSKRAGHTAIYIPTPINKVLIVGGGNNETSVLDTFEIFDVSTLSFIQHGKMKSKRVFHTATLLNNNKTILLAGGRTSFIDDKLASCELFDAMTMSSVTIKCLNEPRFFHTASLIPSTGDVFICGGVNSNKQILSNCELIFF